MVRFNLIGPCSSHENAGENLPPPSGERLSCASSGLPWAIVPKDGVENGEDLTSAGDECLFGWFSCCNETLMICGDEGIEAGAHHSRHVEPVAHVRTAALDVAPAAVFAGIIGHGCDANECCDLSPGESSKFGQIGNEHARELGTDAGKGLQKFILLPPGRSSSHGFGDVTLKIAELFLQRRQDTIDTTKEPGAGERASAVALDPHGLDDLAPAGDELPEPALGFTRDLLGFDFCGFAISGDDP